MAVGFALNCSSMLCSLMSSLSAYEISWGCTLGQVWFSIDVGGLTSEVMWSPLRSRGDAW